jgi:hypothetical protein
MPYHCRQETGGGVGGSNGSHLSTQRPQRQQMVRAVPWVASPRKFPLPCSSLAAATAPSLTQACDAVGVPCCGGGACPLYV